MFVTFLCAVFEPATMTRVAADGETMGELMLRGSGAPHAEQNAPGMGSSTPHVSQMATNDQSASDVPV